MTRVSRGRTPAGARRSRPPEPTTQIYSEQSAHCRSRADVPSYRCPTRGCTHRTRSVAPRSDINLRNPYFALEAAHTLGVDVEWPEQYERGRFD